MASIPTVIMEEHHEAFLIWNHAIQKGWLPERGNVLLHVDEHSDMGVPWVRTPIRQVAGNQAEYTRLTYQELNIATFIIPAMYQGIFDKLHWVRQGFAAATKPTDVQVYSLDGDGKRLVVTKDVAKAGLWNFDRRQYMLQLLRESDGIPEYDSLVLDIDMDYFSCDPSAGQQVRLEVTEKQYLDFISDPYHPLRNHKGPGVYAGCDQSGYFLQLCESHCADSSLKVSDEEVLRRIAAFKDFLCRCSVRPCLIDLCRSRFSTYTPADQWQLIEENLLRVLAELYDLELMKISDLASPLTALSAPQGRDRE
jgi:hypothetical protein